MVRNKKEKIMDRAEDVLESKFQVDLPWDRRDHAFVWVSVSSCLDERTYGSFRFVHKESLQGREFELSLHHTGQVGIRVLDSTYNPRTNKWSNPL
jgi:hypothetical protein